MNKELSLQDRLYIEDLKNNNRDLYWKRDTLNSTKGTMSFVFFMVYLGFLSVFAMGNSYSLEPKFINNEFIMFSSLIAILLNIAIFLLEDSKIRKVDENFKNTKDKLKSLGIDPFYN